jgi:thiol-disulfide isomerase/thioredoxin
MKRRNLLCAFAVILAGALIGCNHENKPTGGPTDSTLTVCGFDGVEKAIADAKGKVVLIDCWATWCPPCVKSFPELVAKSKKYSDKGLAVISLSLDDESNQDDVIAFLKKNHATFTNLQLKSDAAASNGMAEKFGFKGSIPHAVLFDRNGARVWSGHPMDDSLTGLIEKELAKKPYLEG